MRSIDEVANKAFQIPTLYVVAGYLLMVVVLAVGTWLSMWLDDWTWLARFGAFLVCLALMFEVTGLPESFASKVIAITEEATVETVFRQVMKHPYLYGVSPDTSDEQLANIFDREHRRRLMLTKDVMLGTIRKKIQRHEFCVATLGTLLWAFADLLNKL